MVLRVNNIIKRIWKQDELVQIEDLTGMAFRAEEKGHTFQISGKRKGDSVSISGTVSAKFLKADNTTTTISGSASGGVVSLTLADACYTVKGRFQLTIFLTSDSQTAAIYAAIGAVV
jgi:hypothetical protein